MPKLIKKDCVLDDAWQTLPRDYEGALPDGPVLVPMQYYIAHQESLKNTEQLGVWIDSDQEPEELEPFIRDLSLVAINFPIFGDGRGYSYARIIRERYGFEGELRAIGDVLRDQMFYMRRCGFDAFAVPDHKDAESAAESLSDFSESYQAATDQKDPLFRRR